MDQKKLDRISELTRISRQRELTPEETQERTALRNEYRRAFVGNLEAQLGNMSIVQPDGSVINVRDRKKEPDGKDNE